MGGLSENWSHRVETAAGTQWILCNCQSCSDHCSHFLRSGALIGLFHGYVATLRLRKPIKSNFHILRKLQNIPSSSAGLGNLTSLVVASAPLLLSGLELWAAASTPVAAHSQGGATERNLKTGNLPTMSYFLT